jgi:hypothetical protein
MKLMKVLFDWWSFAPFEFVVDMILGYDLLGIFVNGHTD